MVTNQDVNLSEGPKGMCVCEHTHSRLYTSLYCLMGYIQQAFNIWKLNFIKEKHKITVNH